VGVASFRPPDGSLAVVRLGIKIRRTANYCSGSKFSDVRLLHRLEIIAVEVLRSGKNYKDNVIGRCHTELYHVVQIISSPTCIAYAYDT
jgi:hypothetical protein